MLDRTPRTESHRPPALAAAGAVGIARTDCVRRHDGSSARASIPVVALLGAAWRSISDTAALK